MIGKTISHYNILEKLGEGGMGVVYKAEDTKLKRTVALKFLPSNALSAAAEKERFLREAQAAAALNHPNIAHIYAIEEVEGQTFIAMECIDGKSLHEIIGVKGGSPWPIDRAISYTTQIAEGLQAAHEKGIIHRDIKSANIMVTDMGKVKIMDFGLAKLANRTMLTQEGTTLGTIAYMSPEQARGETVGIRSDIWSLGVVLYEMISGQLPFKGDYEQAVVYSIMNENPEPITGLRTGVPMELERIVDKAMPKDPDERYQHVEEIAVDLKSVKTSTAKPSGISTTTSRTTTTSPSGLFKWLVPWSIAVLMSVLALIASWKALEINRGAEPSVTRLSITMLAGDLSPRVRPARESPAELLNSGLNPQNKTVTQ